MIVAVQLTPPGRFLVRGQAELGVDGAAAFGALSQQVAVLVGLEVAPDVGEQDDEEGRAVAEAVHPGRVDVVLERADGPDEGGGDVVADAHGGDGDDEEEFERGVAEEGGEAREEAVGGGLVVVDGVVQAVADRAPGQEGQEGAGFEAQVGAGGLGVVVDLLRRSLVFDVGPRAGDCHEEILCFNVNTLWQGSCGLRITDQPCKQVENERHEELFLPSQVVLRYQEWIPIADLTLLPRAPVSSQRTKPMILSEKGKRHQCLTASHTAANSPGIIR